MPVLRQIVGDTLRALRLRQRRTLREVSADARVSLGYLSEVERGQKEASSELLSAICGALDLELSELFAEVSAALAVEEKLAPINRVTLLGTQTTRLTPASESLAAATRRPDAVVGGGVSQAGRPGGASVRSLKPKTASLDASAPATLDTPTAAA